MIPFLVVVVVLTAAALACVLPPLLRSASGREADTLSNLQVLREQVRELDEAMRDGALTPAAHAEANEELKRRVAVETRAASGRRGDGEQRLLAGALALLVPLVAGGLYYKTGSPAALAVASPQQKESAEPQHEISAADVSTLVQGLSDRMRREPDNADGWYMLARSYTAIGRYQDAVLAYQRLLVLVPDDSAVLADYADVLATVQGGTLTGKPEELVLQALALNPRDIKALALAGNAALQRGDVAAARRHWEQVLPLAPADSALGQSTRASLAQLAPAAPAQAAGPAAQAPRALTGTVSLAPEWASSVAPGDAVFIFARAVQGPRAPLAVKRITVADLPYRFELDDAQAMSPELKLSSAAEVVVTARVSRSGSAIPATGDLEARSASVPANAQDIALRIDRRIE